jgi:hypothetical protein
VDVFCRKYRLYWRGTWRARWNLVQTLSLILLSNGQFPLLCVPVIGPSVAYLELSPTRGTWAYMPNIPYLRLRFWLLMSLGDFAYPTSYKGALLRS